MSIPSTDDRFCYVCRNSAVDPRQLKCGHSFCYRCILSGFDGRLNQIICKRCRMIDQFESFTHFETSFMIDGFVHSLFDEEKNERTISTRTLLAFTLEDILRRTPTPFLVAKCAECGLRKELVICPECERVICFECISQHQMIVNRQVEQVWKECEKCWNEIRPKSILFDEFRIDLDQQITNLKSAIENRTTLLVETIKKSKHLYENLLKEFSRKIFDFQDEIDRRFGQLAKICETNDLSTFDEEFRRFNEFLGEKIERLKKFDRRKVLYSTKEIDSTLIGTISFCDWKRFREENSISTKSNVEQAPNKKLLWTIDFKFVPQHIVLYRQSILFASDRWGFVSTWNYFDDGKQPMPRKSFLLFPKSRNETRPRRFYVESFSVYDPYICVFVKESDESVTNFIGFFSHKGRIQMKIDYDYRESLRQLICDESPKGNCIWAVDRGTNCIYQYDLPRTKETLESFVLNRTKSRRLSSRICDVIRMASNENLLALLDARTQIVTLFDKTTHQQTEISSQELLSNQNHKLWRVELFPDDSLLLRFDDHERTGDQSQIIHHIVVHLKQINGKYRTISQIQATNAYGFAIASNSQVILGLRKPDSFEGLISCYL